MDEGHPIPQDITGFQFRIIGDMTIKQFAYLLVSALLAWFCISLPIFFIIKVLLALAVALTGITLAFIPIQGRPADTMISLFIKALFKPNEYSRLEEQTIAEKTATPTSVLENKPIVQEDQKEEKIFFESNPPVQTTVEAPEEETQTQPEKTTQSEEEPEQIVQEQEEQTVTKAVDTISKELQEAKEQEQQAKDAQDAQAAHQKVLDLQTQMQTLVTQKEDLERQLIALKQELEKKPKQVFTPSEAVEEQVTQRVKKIPDPMTKTVGAPFTPDVPNVITGVIKDSRGNVLPNILVEVKDKDDNPVRAFKTNSLGQFASATPLLNGVYTITFDDPKKKQSFDIVEIVADGTILQPLEIISIDERELLRKSLFTG